MLGFVLGVGVALARLSGQGWLHYAATLYVQVIRGVPLAMVVFWFVIPIALGVWRMSAGVHARAVAAASS